MRTIIKKNDDITIEYLISKHGINTLYKLIEVAAVAVTKNDKQCMQFKSLMNSLVNKFDKNTVQQCVQKLSPEFQRAFM